jgi:hypothetical protein
VSFLKLKKDIMKRLALLFTLFFALSCKKEIDPTPSLTGSTTGNLIDTKWILISSGAYPTCCNGVTKFKLRQTDWKENILTYHFSSDKIIQNSICLTCNDKSTQVTNAQYVRKDNELTITNDSVSGTSVNTIFIKGWQGTSQIQKLTNDTLILGVNYGLEGEYSISIFSKLK